MGLKGWLLCFFMLGATAVMAQAWVVAPGKGVGTLALSMTPAQVAAQLPVSEYIGSPQNPKFVRYGPEVLVEYAGNKAVMITLNNANIKTKTGPVKWTPFSGAGIGSAWNVVEPALGRNYVSRDLKTAKSQPREVYYAYTTKGLGFRTKAGVIVQVDIWPAR